MIFYIDGIVAVSLLCGFFGVLLVTTIDLFLSKRFVTLVALMGFSSLCVLLDFVSE